MSLVPTMSNPFAALVTPVSSSETAAPSPLCQQLETIFGFTLSEERSRSVGLVHLAEQSELFAGRELDVEIVEHALFERLFLSQPEVCVVGVKGPAHTAYCEHDVITYLYHCYQGAEVLNATDNRAPIINFICRNVGTILQQPDLHETQQVFDQFYNVLKTEIHGREFFADVYDCMVRDVTPEAIKEAFTPVFKLLHDDLERTTITTANNNVFDVMDTICSKELLAAQLIDSSTPAVPVTGYKFTKGILGCILSISVLPAEESGTYNFFQNPMDQASISSTENQLFSSIERLSELIHTIFIKLLRGPPTVREKVLHWIGDCLKHNSDRSKIWNESRMFENIPTNQQSAPDGFMINLTYVLVRLCNPFASPENYQKILKVDPTYCAVPPSDYAAKSVHLHNLEKDTCIVSFESDESAERPTSDKYSFITECFFMTHRALEIGYKVTASKLLRLNQEIARIEGAYNEAIAQGGARNEVVENIQQRMSSLATKYLSMKVVLSEPNLVKLTLSFITATSYYMTQLAVPTNRNAGNGWAPAVHRDVTFPLSTTIPETLKCIPEFIFENFASFLVHLRRFVPRTLEVEGYTIMEPILTAIIIYMGDSQRVRNPHLRARLAEALEALIPHHKDEPQALNSMGGFQREMLFKQHPHRAQIVDSLLEVFVGIEMTGQSVEFQDKFSYRRPMYLIMEYLWEFEEYQGYFKKLALAAEKSMEALNPPLFLRFVNLLMNDAVFLLDEALTTMSKLREMQTKLDNGEWNELPANERQQQLTFMQHSGMNAKSYNILGKDTIRTLEQLTSKIANVFTHPTMVDRIAGMLNYFLLNLVGPNKKNFKVKDLKNEYQFDPANTVLMISRIYVNLGTHDGFCLAISQDGRSYRAELFQLAENVLIRIGGGSLIVELQVVAERVREAAIAHQENEDAVAEAPENYLDPIMSTLMLDPVILPSSKQTVDRTTIARHLLSDQTDPFNRSPLTMDQIIPNEELATEIKAWLTSRTK